MGKELGGKGGTVLSKAAGKKKRMGGRYGMSM